MNQLSMHGVEMTNDVPRASSWGSSSWGANGSRNSTRSCSLCAFRGWFEEVVLQPLVQTVVILRYQDTIRTLVGALGPLVGALVLVAP